MLVITEEFTISMDCPEGSSSDAADLCLLTKKMTMIQFDGFYIRMYTDPRIDKEMGTVDWLTDQYGRRKDLLFDIDTGAYLGNFAFLEGMQNSIPSNHVIGKLLILLTAYCLFSPVTCLSWSYFCLVVFTKAVQYIEVLSLFQEAKALSTKAWREAGMSNIFSVEMV